MPHLLDRGCHRLGQERLRQRAHHQPADARHARRGAARPGRPQARRARCLRRPAAPQDARHRRGARGAQAALDWAVREMEDRYKLLAAHGRAQHRGLQRQPAARPGGAAAVHRAGHRRAGRPDHARGPQGRGPDRQDRPEGARRRHPPRARDAAAVGQRGHRASSRPTCRAGSRSRWRRTSTRGPCSTQPGAEDLIGRGDMLYQPADLPRPVRLQGVFVTRRRGPRGHRRTGATRRRAPATTPTCWRAATRTGRAAASSAGSPQMAEDEHDAARGRARDRLDRQGQHVDAADQAQGRLQPREPRSWTSSSATASSGRRIRATRPCRARSTAPTTGCASPDDVDDRGPDRPRGSRRRPPTDRAVGRKGHRRRRVS